MEFFNKVKKYAKVRFGVGIVAVGLIFTIIGAASFFVPKGEVETTTGTITDIVEEYDSDLQSTTYHVIITYRAAGKRYENAEYGSYSSGMKVGDTVEVEYSVKDPTVINAPGSEKTVLIVLAAGIAALVYGVISTKKALSETSEELNEYDRVDISKADPTALEQIKNSTEAKNNYFFHFTGKMNQSYALEDANHNMIYEAKLQKLTMVKDSDYEFINHVTGESSMMKIGHTVSQSISGGTFNFRVPISSAFKVNGISNWDYLADKGYGFDFSMKGLMPCFHVKHYGVEVAYIETTGTDVFGEKETKNPLSKLPVNGCFRVECRDSDLDGVFMTCLSITKAIFYENN